MRIVRVAGYLILAASIVFLGYRLYTNLGNLFTIKLNKVFYLAILMASVYFGILQFFIVAALSALLKGFGADGVTFLKVLNFHGRTDIAKYLPGNVFHFAGRQVLAKNYGWSQSAVGLSSIAETVLVILGGGLAAMIFVGFANAADALYLLSKFISPSVILWAGAGIASLWIVGAQAGRIPYLSRFSRTATVQKFSRSPYPPLAVALYLVFFLSCGLMFWALLSALDGKWQADLIGIVGFSYTTSWLAGKMTPGAPGGIGVREAALVLLLGGVIGEAEALMLGVALRIVTTLGDFFLFGTALLFKPKEEFHAPGQEK
jgi:hypothetical protein